MLYTHAILQKWDYVTLFYFLKKFVYWLRWVFTAASGGYSLIAVLELLAVASHDVERGLQVHGFVSCGSWALEHHLSSCGTWA